MTEFKDNAGQAWKVVVNVGQVQRVRDLLKVDLYGLFEGDQAKQLFGDPVVLVNTLYVLCSEQAKERNVTDEQFGTAFGGDSLEAAANALLEEVLLFFPSSRRTLLRATVKKATLLGEEMQAKVLKAIEAMTVTDLMPPSGE